MVTNLPNTITAANVNAHPPLWYWPNKDNRGELIEGALLNSNQTQRITLPVVSANHNDCTTWNTIHFLTSNHLP